MSQKTILDKTRLMKKAMCYIHIYIYVILIYNWKRKWQPTPVFLPGESQGRGSLVGCRLWGHKELDTTERLPFHFSLPCIGEGNGNPLQCSCLENSRDGVTQSRTRLKRLSSSSSSRTRLPSNLS